MEPVRNCIAKSEIFCKFYQWDPETKDYVKKTGLLLMVLDYYEYDQYGEYAPGYYLAFRPHVFVQGYHPRTRVYKSEFLFKNKSHYELQQKIVEIFNDSATIIKEQGLTIFI